MNGMGNPAVYRGCTPVVEERFDPNGDRTIIPTLVDAIAEAEGVDASELPPLQNNIDLDAVTHLVEKHEGAANADAILGFKYQNWHVFVGADGRILVGDRTKPTDPEPVF